MPRRARPGRQLDAPLTGSGGELPALPPGAVAAVAGSQACPVVMTACSCRKIAAAMMVCAWVGVSLFWSLLVRCW